MLRSASTTASTDTIVPEGQGREIEIDMRERPFGIVAAIGKDGVPMIKALMDGDTKLYEEPLY